MTKDQIEQLRKEATVLLNGKGEGFEPADQYAPDRVVSKISGVKNIRRSERDSEGTLCVKTHGRVNVPSVLLVKGRVYKVIELYTNQIVK